MKLGFLEQNVGCVVYSTPANSGEGRKRSYVSRWIIERLNQYVRLCGSRFNSSSQYRDEVTFRVRRMNLMFPIVVPQLYTKIITSPYDHVDQDFIVHD